MFYTSLLALCLVLAAGPTGEALGQTRSTLNIVNPDSALAATLSRLPGEPLTLERALRLAETHASPVLEARAALTAADGTWMREKGAFDPELFADLSTSRQENPTSSPFARPDVIETEQTVLSGGARWILPLGTELEASLNARREDSNSEFASLNPEYRADGLLEIRQPLLRGFGPGTSSDKHAAGQRRHAARAGYRDAALSTRAQVEQVYWLLYTAEQDVAVQKLIVDSAEALLEQAQLRARAGLVGPRDVANARVFLAEQRLAALDLDERLGTISDQLGSLLGERPDGDRFRSVDQPPEVYPVQEIDQLLTAALRNNATLQAAEAELAASEAQARGGAWNRLPELDVVGSLGGTGLSGTAREVIFGGDTLLVDEDGAYADASSEALSRDFPNWSVGLQLTLPLPLREGRGEHRRLQGEADRARARVLAVRRALEERLRSAHRELQNSRERLTVAREGIDASFEQVRIGLIEYENGRTTAFELVRLSSDLARAQQRLSNAQVRAATAAADLRYLTAGEDDTRREVRP